MSNVYFNGFALTLGLIMAIGAQNAHVLRQGLRGEHVLLTVSVSALCDMVLITLGVAGLGSLFVAKPDLMSVARYGGAAFLIFYGARALRSALRGGRAVDVTGHRRLSRGQALLAAAEQHARARGCCKLTLEVLTGNARALKSYLGFGFEPYALDPAAGQASFMQKWL